MKELNYWQQFINTGSIDAYLNYRMEQDGSTIGKNQDRRDLGVNSYAGVCSSDRNDFEGGACR